MSLDSEGYTLGIIGFIRCHWIHSRAPWVSLVSFACARVFVGSIRGRRVHSHDPRGRWIHPVSFSSHARALLGVGFIYARPRCRWGHPHYWGSLACALGFVGWILCQWVNSRSPCVSLGLSEVLGSLTWILGVVGFIRAVGVTRALPGGRWAHPGTFCLLARVLGFVGFIQPRYVHSRAPCIIQGCWVHSRAPWWLSGSSGVVLFPRARPMCRWFYQWF